MVHRHRWGSSRGSRCASDRNDTGSLGGSGRPDLILDYLDEEGIPHRVLSEHKIDAELTHFQRLAYADWHPDALVLVAPGAYRGSGFFDQFITWASVAERIRRLGVECAGSDWRRLALDPDQPTGLRCLEELLAFLERHNVGVPNMAPLDESTVTAYAALRATLSKLETLFAMLRDDRRIQACNPSPVLPQLNKTQWWISLDAVARPYLARSIPNVGRTSP